MSGLYCYNIEDLLSRFVYKFRLIVTILFEHNLL